MRKILFTGLAALGALAVASLLFLFGARSDARADAPMRLTEDGHYTTPVTINGKGPFSFIVDTGAQRSVVSSTLANALGLMRMPGVSIKASSGTGAGGLSFLESYSSPLFSRFSEMVAVLPEGGLVKEGVMGMNLFSSRRLELDFAALSVRNSDSGSMPAGFIAIPVSINQGSFIIADGVVDGVRTKVMVDTGARRTIGNSLLRNALRIPDGDPRLSPAEPVGGATADKTSALKAEVGGLSLGAHRFEHSVITFADVPVLETLELNDGPALILGLDLLGTLKAVAIDYPRSELQIKP